MNSEIRQLEPKVLWNKFADLNAVPRPSKKEERVIEFMKDFGKNLGLETIEDEVGNVIIRKPATKGFEDRKMVVLQSHLDMVHQKNNDTKFDFDTQGIEMYVDGDWVRAQGTTLGADNGLGVATIMAILESDIIEHPAIEALFTIDEETGMTGAKGLKGGLLKGDILLNLDTEEDDEIGVGCAGGIDVTATGEYSEVNAPENSVSFEITLNGLQGGHSGMDIIKGLGNANKLMNRVLFATKNFLQISKLEGGSLRNAIPRESVAKVVVTSEKEFLADFENIKSHLLSEYKSLEPNLSISAQKIEAIFEKVMDSETQIDFLNVMNAAHNGVYRMSPDIQDLVETSNNIAKVNVGNGQIKIECLTRSSVESSKEDLANALTSVFELAGAKIVNNDGYPGWQPNANSELLKVAQNEYKKLYNKGPKVKAIHAGLECGLFLEKYPNLDMISIGPDMTDVHSPDEKMKISSVGKFWDYLVKILENLPEEK